MAGDDGLGDEFLQGHAETDFTGYSVSFMKKMLEEVNFSEGGRVSHAWLTVRNSLAGEDGEGRAAGSIAGDLRKAVREVKDHWHGPAAEAFATAAERLAKDFVHAAAQAKDASEAVEAAFQELKTAKDVLDDLEEPGVLARAGDYLSDWGSRDDSGLKDDVADPTASGSMEAKTQDNEGDLSAGKEYQMRGAAALTRLAGAYRVQANRMDGIRNDETRPAPENSGPGGGGGAVPTPVIVAPVPSGHSTSRGRPPSGTAPKSPAAEAPQRPATAGPPPSGANVDSADPGTATKQPPGEAPAASRPAGPQPGGPTAPGAPGVAPPAPGMPGTRPPGTPTPGGGPGSPGTPGRTTPGTPAPQQGGVTAARGGAPGTYGTPVPGAAGTAGGAAGERTKAPRGRPRFVQPPGEEPSEKPKPVSRAGQSSTPGGTGLGTRGRGMRADAKQKLEEDDEQQDPLDRADDVVEDDGTRTPNRSRKQSDEAETE